MSLPEGTDLGSYRIEEPIGRGGFALVYRAYDPRLDAHVAVKVLAENHAFDPEISVRFSDEARLLRSLRSTAVVTVFDVGSLPTGQPYMVLEYADRGTLADRLRGDRSVDRSDLRRLIHFLAEAIGTLHEAGLVHRDIKPSNVLVSSSPEGEWRSGAILSSDERLLLGDFGLAKDLAEASGLTVGVGTDRYAAPEQRVELGRVDRRSDIYSATALLVEAMVGLPPEHCSWLDWLESETPNGTLKLALADGLADDPDLRPENAEQWKRSLDAGLDADRGNSRHWPFGGKRVLLMAGAAVLAVVAGFGIWRFWPGSESTPDEVEEAVSAEVVEDVPEETDQEESVEVPATSEQQSQSDDAGSEVQPAMARVELPEVELSAGVEEVLPPDELEQAAQNAEVGSGRFRCRPTLMANLDPLRALGSPERAWHNTFFGNVASPRSATPAASIDEGATSCSGGTVNRSSFWVSTLYDPATLKPVPIDHLYVRYDGLQVEGETLTHPELGFSSLAGDEFAVEVAADSDRNRWRCRGGSFAPTIVRCPPGDEQVHLWLQFPDCWNGAADPNSLVFSERLRACPESHPIRVPSTTLVVVYDTAGIDDTSALRASTDHPEVAGGGLSVNGGFIHGWDPEHFEHLLDNCLRVSLDCYFDNLGANRPLAETPG